MEWYKNIGGKLSFTIFINIITPHISKILKAVIHKMRRKIDRGFFINSLKKLDTDEVNSK